MGRGWKRAGHPCTAPVPYPTEPDQGAVEPVCDAGECGDDERQPTAAELCRMRLCADARTETVGAEGHGVGTGAGDDDPTEAAEDWGADPDHSAESMAVDGDELSAAGAVWTERGRSCAAEQRGRSGGAESEKRLRAIAGGALVKNQSSRLTESTQRDRRAAIGGLRADRENGHLKTATEFIKR